MMSLTIPEKAQSKEAWGDTFSGDLNRSSSARWSRAFSQNLIASATIHFTKARQLV
jgi:hypothetical protein